MPKILVDNSKNIQDRTYAVKTCPVCGSIIEISEQEAMNTPINGDGFMEFDCPCGQKLSIRKYFGGRKYSDKDYMDCLNYFKESVDKVIYEDLQYCRNGYGKFYFWLNHTELVVTPLCIHLNVYIDRYDHGNWKKRISVNEPYCRFDYNLCDMSGDLEQCARYAQALSDYIVFAFNEIRKKGINLKLKSVDRDKLTAYYRNADIDLSEEEMVMLTSRNFHHEKQYHNPANPFASYCGILDWEALVY